jgi:aspartyl-tRNA(Asn)/glutamyl-tRNA(Gln) amidotransferase subunit B
MQQGSFRCDANVSVRKQGDTKLGTRCEIKNLNSFRFMEQAIEYEARRQIELIEDGKAIAQETRLYDPERNETRSMRSKEDAQDYRYFPDPDLLPLVISEEDIQRVHAEMPKTLEARRFDIRDRYPVLPANNVAVITGTSELADYSALVLSGTSGDKTLVAANLIAGVISARMNEDGVSDPSARISAANLRSLAELVSSKRISTSTANHVASIMWTTQESPEKIVRERNLEQVSDAGAIEKIVDEAMAAGAKLVEDYRAGKEKAFNALVGQVMKASKGKANPAQVNEILRRKLKG